MNKQKNGTPHQARNAPSRTRRLRYPKQAPRQTQTRAGSLTIYNNVAGAREKGTGARKPYLEKIAEIAS
jgi:hypothetical protein